ncbi:MAG: LptF/LptG family permease [Verrucomicrobia bacterium]|nr:LptF/LptG family permease [Verrucomicrobiota bacterium]
MRLLDRYLLRELLVPLGYCFFGFLIFWMSFDVIGELDDYNAAHLKGGEIALLYLLRVPEFTLTVGPVALLLALLYALTNLARHHELTAIRAAGVGLARMCAPFFAVGFIGSLMLLVLNEGIAPACAEMAEQVRTRHVRELLRPELREWQMNLNFHNARERRYWAIQEYNTVTAEMRRPRVIWVLLDGARRDITAEKALYFDGAWTFYNVQELTYSGQPGALPVPFQTNQIVFPAFNETPAQIKSEIKIGNLTDMKAAKKVRLTTSEILNYIQLHPHPSPREEAMLFTQLHTRLAMPWTALVVVLVAIPFGTPAGRRNVFVSVAGSIFIVFAFFVLQQVGLTLGTGGYVAPWLAGWGPNALFSIMGLVLTRRVR